MGSDQRGAPCRRKASRAGIESERSSLLLVRIFRATPQTSGFFPVEAVATSAPRWVLCTAVTKRTRWRRRIHVSLFPTPLPCRSSHRQDRFLRGKSTFVWYGQNISQRGSSRIDNRLKGGTVHVHLAGAAPRATAMIEPTKVRIILGLTSTMSSGSRKMVHPILRATEMAYLAF